MSFLATKHVFFYGSVFFSIFSYSLFAQVQEKSYDESWEDWKENAFRIKDQRERISKGQALPFLILRYTGKKKNKLAFYDLEGRESYYRYRRDRFDKLAEKKLPPLIKGEVYRVSGAFLGLSFQNVFISKNSPQFQEKIKNPDAVLVFQFQSAKVFLGRRTLF